MKRRNFLAFLGGVAAAWPALAQQPKRLPVVALVLGVAPVAGMTGADPLQSLGYREGINLRIEVVSGENELDRLPKLAASLVASSPDVIVAVNTPGTRAAVIE